MTTERPRFPITVKFLEDNEEEVYASELDLATDLEFFETDSASIATDATGRRVHFRIQACGIELLEYLEQ